MTLLREVLRVELQRVLAMEREREVELEAGPTVLPNVHHDMTDPPNIHASMSPFYPIST
jgi:hypothetical protein